jgi:hypothetical protein
VLVKEDLQLLMGVGEISKKDGTQYFFNTFGKDFIKPNLITP